MRNELLLCTVIFSQNIPYLEDFFKSVINQDTTLFDFLVINEDVDITQYSEWLGKAIVIQSVGSPLENRIHMIRYAKEKGYKYILWQDSDDVCSIDRISTLKNEIGDNDVIIHDMRLIDKRGALISDTFVGNRYVDKRISYDDIKYKNIIGFGNTMICVDSINYNIHIPESIKAVDWWIACLLLLEGRTAKYINGKLSDYRQYDLNLANLEITTIDQLKLQLIILNAHYTELIKVLADNKNLKNELIQHNHKIEVVLKNLCDENFKSTIVQMLSEKVTLQCVWWEKINNIIKEVKI